LEDSFSGDMREEPAEALGRIRPADSTALAALTLALRHEAARVRAWAAKAIGRAGKDAEPAVSALLAAIRDNSRPYGAFHDVQGYYHDHEIRTTAAWALGQIGPAAKKALPVLRRLANAEGTDWCQSCVMVDAIRRIEGR
jgi:HEAT repeat protein